MMNRALQPELEFAMRRILEDVYPKWAEQQPVDVLRHVERKNSGFSVKARSYKGSQTWGRFSTAIVPEVQQLEAALQRYQPELLSFVQTSSAIMKLQPEPWLQSWITYLDSSPAPTLATKIDALIADLKRVLAGGGKLIATTTVMGLILPEAISDIRLELRNSEEVRLHRMTDEEFSETHSKDVIFDTHPVGMSFRLPDTVLSYQRPAEILLRPTPDHPLSTSEHTISEEISSKIVLALTLTKAGHFLAASTSYRIVPSVIPTGLGGFHRTERMPAVTVELLPTEIDKLRENLGRLLDARPEISIAGKRLVDAEGRSNPADMVVDAAIGLETLLLRDRQELTYRVKLNYAFLAPFQERHKRVSELNELYNWRGKIVHGSAGDADMVKLHNVASIGKAALRYAILQFLRDPALRKDAKLDNEYWIDRIVRGYLPQSMSTAADIF